MIWVMDASVAVKWFLRDEHHPHAQKVLEEVVRNPALFAVPELFLFEVYAVLKRRHPRGDEAFIDVILPILEGGIYRQPMTKKLTERAGPFVGMGLTGYDACYAALAEDLGALWITFDEKAHNLIAHRHVSHNLMEGLPEGW